MGLLDQVLGTGGAMAGQQGEEGKSLLDIVMALINNPQTGGLSGLVQSFERGGLGEVARSWVSSGQNLPISAEQIQSVFGSEQIQNVASQLGVAPDQASGQLAEFLPRIIDQLTPGGTVPEGDGFMAQGATLLKGKLFG